MRTLKEERSSECECCGSDHAVLRWYRAPEYKQFKLKSTGEELGHDLCAMCATTHVGAEFQHGGSQRGRCRGLLRRQLGPGRPGLRGGTSRRQQRQCTVRPMGIDRGPGPFPLSGNGPGTPAPGPNSATEKKAGFPLA